MFAALNDEERRKTYVAFAFLYSLPLLERGLSFDPYVLLCVLACILHVQVGPYYVVAVITAQQASRPEEHDSS